MGKGIQVLGSNTREELWQLSKMEARHQKECGKSIQTKRKPITKLEGKREDETLCKWRVCCEGRYSFGEDAEIGKKNEQTSGHEGSIKAWWNLSFLCWKE